MAKGWVGVKGVAIAAIAVGLVLRFSNLDRKVYWHDEAYTSLRVAGYMGPAVQDAVLDRPDLTPSDLLHYQQMPPSPSLVDCWDALANHPEHPPLYYLAAHGWGRIFGASVGGYRAIAAIFGAIALAAMFWLGRQLFPLNPPVAWLATALMAVSPVQIIYSQEAREYSLWAVGLLLTHGALVRALRLNQPLAWLAYGLALGLSWYGSLMTGLLGLSHLAFMALTQRQRRPWLGFVLAHGLGIGLFAPWIWTIVWWWERLKEVTAWTDDPQPLDSLAKLWGLHYSAAVVDFNLPLDHPFTVAGPALVLGLVAVSLVHIGRHYPRSTAVFLGCGLLVPPLVLIGGDIVRTGQISTNTRYFFPSLLLVPLAIAPLINAGLAAALSRSRALGAALLALLLTLGIASGFTNTRALTWWNKSLSYPNLAIANYLNQESAPVVIFGPSGITLGEAISLSHYLNPDTTLWLLSEQALPTAAALQTVVQAQPQTSLFLFEPAPPLLETVPSGWQTAPATDATEFSPTDLVRLIPPQES
ncbi:MULTISPECIES: glycosyltransferase family 39 protein [Cyanophyceae]|uniref:glycosyltransferase family 39 protein n=1 Tax=Cyanophyceae TaxID=3028117 RepID=UPI0016886B7D|nr:MULTISPECIES: glycosyltransferase family 39 protein [Cyanophyceae]MBD1918559.1 glycosyltransferase family 39 protein [Phormidium sp. FACHB-77]MBD2031448.1 glycosyltransferase family 39 protein [Phormidium sp. FACHB-322]MBD2049567.1 glycosyltransferase family 39 protein [Leptolyngbya sp. FACHB-60]